MQEFIDYINCNYYGCFISPVPVESKEELLDNKSITTQGFFSKINGQSLWWGILENPYGIKTVLYTDYLQIDESNLLVEFAVNKLKDQINLQDTLEVENRWIDKSIENYRLNGKLL